MTGVQTCALPIYLLQLLYVYLYGHDELARYQLGKHKEIREQGTIRYSNRTLRRREKRK